MNKEEKTIAREILYEGKILNLEKVYVKLPNENTSTREVVRHHGACAVLAVDHDDAVMVRQYRNALERFTLEIPAGALDEPEEPGKECSARELEEETGYRSEELEWLITLRTTVAFCNERIEVYVAKNLISTKQHLDDNEFVNVEKFTIEELKQKIFTGEIEDSKTVAALLAYDAKYNR